MSLDYNTALKLKNAGFSQKTTNCHGLYYREGDSGYLISEYKDGIEKEFVYFPTLEELIEACGDEFLAILKLVHKRDNNWECRGRRTKTTEYHLFADTPSEAVALLWLALNEK